MTFLAAELNTGKCHSFHEPSLSGMLYRPEEITEAELLDIFKSRLTPLI